MAGCRQPGDACREARQHRLTTSMGEYFYQRHALVIRPMAPPLRVRIERQLDYKMAKYIMRIEAVETFAHIGGGKGGYWEDDGYEWYAGI